MIADRSKLHAIRIPDRFAGEGRESYRVFVPNDSLYWAFVVVNNIPKQGYPELKRYPSRNSILGCGTDLPLHGRLEPGEHVLTIRKDHRNPDHTKIQLIVDDLDASTSASIDRWPTVVPETYATFGDGVSGTTAATDSSGQLVLQRHRLIGVTEAALDASYAMPEPDMPLDGFMVWIEREPGGK